MSEDRLFAKAAKLYREGNLEAAKAILEELDTPEAQRALNRVNSAISAKKQAALANHSGKVLGVKNLAQEQSQAPQNAPVLPDYTKMSKAKNAPKVMPKNGNFVLGLFAVLAICSVCWIGFMSTMPSQPRESIEEICRWQEMAAPSTHCSPERIMRDYRPAIDACYAIWNDANIYNIVEWTNCLENKSVDLID